MKYTNNSFCFVMMILFSLQVHTGGWKTGGGGGGIGNFLTQKHDLFVKGMYSVTPYKCFSLFLSNL